MSLQTFRWKQPTRPSAITRWSASHLKGGAEEPSAPSEEKESDAEGDQDTHLGVARTIPDNPTGGADFALSIGYQIVTGVMQQRR